MMTAQQAIEQRIIQNTIVTLEFDGVIAEELSAASDNSVTNGPVTEYWGVDDDGDDWRVHMTRQDVTRQREDESIASEDSVVTDHIREYAAKRGDDDWWLPAVWSEDDPALRSALTAELGLPQPSGYMSEECGWEVDPPYKVRR